MVRFFRPTMRFGGSISTILSTRRNGYRCGRNFMISVMLYTMRCSMAGPVIGSPIYHHPIRSLRGGADWYPRFHGPQYRVGRATRTGSHYNRIYPRLPIYGEKALTKPNPVFARLLNCFTGPGEFGLTLEGRHEAE